MTSINIPNFIRKPLNNPKFTNLAQNTIACVGIETALKATGRPMFIMMDKNADKEEKKYAAVKEFLYQGCCLVLYLTILPQIKKAGFWGLKKLYKMPANKNNIKEIHKQFNEFPNYKAFTDHIKALKDEKTPNTLVKGALELVSIIGSVLTLTMIAPKASHIILHPIMHWMEKGKAQKATESRPKP